MGFKSVKILGARDRFDSEDVLELGKHVPHVEYDVGTSCIWGPLLLAYLLSVAHIYVSLPGS